jgi:hypothetical protein
VLRVADLHLVFVLPYVCVFVVVLFRSGVRADSGIIVRPFGYGSRSRKKRGDSDRGKSRKKLVSLMPPEPVMPVQPLVFVRLALDWRTRPVSLVSQPSPSDISDVLPAGSVAAAVKNPLNQVL